MKYTYFLYSAFLITILTLGAFAQGIGILDGQVTDELGAAVSGATVYAVDSAGKEKTAVTNSQGNFSIKNLIPGTYIVRVDKETFSPYENLDVVVKSGETQTLDVTLTVQGVEEQVEVSADQGVNTDPDSNLSATVLKEADLEALPDDPDELEAALQALAGGSAGPNGGQIYIDGFTGGNLPPKESIREIRINSNPFSAEYDRLGFGRIEILTKPGTDKFRGSAFFNFNDESLNSRNPFSTNRAPSQTRYYGGNFSGPVQKNKSSFFVDVSNRAIDSGENVNARILDPNFNIVTFNQEFTVPTRRFEISPRFDYQINQNNTLILRYSFERDTSENRGIGGFSLPTRAYERNGTEHDFRLTETMIINPKTINETRFQYQQENSDSTGDNTIPTINVSDAFTGGGAQVGLSFDRQTDLELQNYTTTSLGKNAAHSVKFGVKMEYVKVDNRSESNFGGTFTFTGFSLACPTTNPTCNNDPIRQYDLNGDNFISSIEQYRAKLLGAADSRFNPNQFRLSSGNPLADVKQFDIGAFITDDWRVSQKLTLSFGLRYENQTNISDSLNFAPRFGFAYSPGAGGARPPKTVFRGGAGIFYERFSDNLVLNSNRFNGTNQQNYVITNSNSILGQPIFTLDGVTNVPTAAQLSSVAPLSSIPQLLSPDLQAPYTIQTALGVERQLPYNFNVSAFYVASRTLHVLRSRNINAPLCPPGAACPITDLSALNALRPDPTQGNIYQYESSGFNNSQQFIINFRTFIPASGISLFGNYRLGKSESDTDGAGTFPSYSYDASNDFGRSSFDTRHFLFFGGSIRVPYGFSLSPFLIANSGGAFNITRGIDTNGDSIFTERPTFAELNNRCGELGLTNSFCDISDVSDPNAIIPRNYGKSPAFVTFNLSVSRNFGFGGSSKPVDSAQGGGGGNNQSIGVRGGRGGGRRGGGGFGGSDRSPYNLNLGLRVNNIFNIVNDGQPVSSLSSPFFGQPVTSAGSFGRFGGSSGNRRIELTARFSW